MQRRVTLVVPELFKASKYAAYRDQVVTFRTFFYKVKDAHKRTWLGEGLACFGETPDSRFSSS